MISNKFYLFSLSFKINILIRSSPKIKNYIVFEWHAAIHWFNLLSTCDYLKKNFLKIKWFSIIFFKKSLCMNHINFIFVVMISNFIKRENTLFWLQQIFILKNSFSNKINRNCTQYHLVMFYLKLARENKTCQNDFTNSAENELFLQILPLHKKRKSSWGDSFPATGALGGPGKLWSFPGPKQFQSVFGGFSSKK